MIGYFSMHEFSTAKGILETVLKVAKENGAKCITEVNLEIGPLTMLNPEQLQFSFQVLSENTMARGAKLNISFSPMKLLCHNCGFDGKISTDTLEDSLGVMTLLNCPKCGSSDTEIDEGRSCNIRNIKVEKNK